MFFFMQEKEREREREREKERERERKKEREKREGERQPSDSQIDSEPYIRDIGGNKISNVKQKGEIQIGVHC